MSSSDTTDIAVPSNPEFSPFAIVAAACGYLLHNFRRIAAAIWLPILASGAVLVLTLEVYFTMLARYLDHPNAQMASLTVGSTVGLLFVWLFLYVVASARLVGLMHDAGAAASDASGRRGVGARLYAAILRFLFILALALGAEGVLLALVASTRMGVHDALVWTGGIGAIAIIAVLSARCAFLQPALALRAQRPVLRGAWRMTKGRTGTFLLLWTVLWLLPAVLLQTIADILIQPMTHGVAAANAASFAAAARDLAKNDAAIVSIAATLTLSLTVALLLTAIGSCLAYDALKRDGAA